MQGVKATHEPNQRSRHQLSIHPRIQPLRPLPQPILLCVLAAHISVQPLLQPDLGHLPCVIEISIVSALNALKAAPLPRGELGVEGAPHVDPLLLQVDAMIPDETHLFLLVRQTGGGA